MGENRANPPRDGGGAVNTWPGWRCVRLLGESGFDRVYEIERTEDGQRQRAALKVITVPQSREDLRSAYSRGLDDQGVISYFREAVQYILREVTLMAQLKGHSNLVSYEDFMVCEREGEIGWDILIRMELLTPLQDYVRTHRLGEAEVISLGRDLCRALELCQNRRIIHRNVRPENIFVNEQGAFQLGDFDIAQAVERVMPGPAKGGDDAYAAPEVCRGESCGQTADLYSLGMVLYVYLNENCLPFLPHDAATEQEREEARRRRLAGEAVPPPRHGSQMLQCAVLKALAFDPQERYQSAEAFREALEACAQQAAEPDPEPVPEPKPEEERAAGKRKIPRWLVGLAAVLVVGLVVAAFPRGGDGAADEEPPEETETDLSTGEDADSTAEPEGITADPFETWPELGENAVLRSFVTDTLEDGLTVTGYEMDADGEQATIYFADAVDGTAAKTVEVAYVDERISQISEYDAAENLTKKTVYGDSGGIAWIQEYDESGREIKFTRYSIDGAINEAHTHEYDGSGNEIKWTVYNGDGTIDYWYTYEYDASGNMTKETIYNGDGTLRRWFTYEYDGSGNIAKETIYNSDGSLWRWDIYEYDESGNKIKDTVYDNDGTIVAVYEF